MWISRQCVVSRHLLSFFGRSKMYVQRREGGGHFKTFLFHCLVKPPAGCASLRRGKKKERWLVELRSFLAGYDAG